jgi:hypothetical protein
MSLVVNGSAAPSRSPFTGGFSLVTGDLQGICQFLEVWTDLGPITHHLFNGLRIKFPVALNREFFLA